MTRRGRSRRSIGAIGEDLAVAYLKRAGYEVLARNYYASHAEIDVICIDRIPDDPHNKDDLVFVEVRTRSDDHFGEPIESVSPIKLNFVRRAAEVYIYAHDLEDEICRFDVIGIMTAPDTHVITHIKDVIEF